MGPKHTAIIGGRTPCGTNRREKKGRSIKLAATKMKRRPSHRKRKPRKSLQPEN